MNAYQFFLRHAGYSYMPGTETPMQGRVRCARDLVKAERAARDRGFSFHWSIDSTTDSKRFQRRKTAWRLWQCAMYNSKGLIVDSLHGIDFGRNGEPWSAPYKRVVEAELAQSGIDNPPQGRGNTYWRNGMRTDTNLPRRERSHDY